MLVIFTKFSHFWWPSFTNTYFLANDLIRKINGQIFSKLLKAKKYPWSKFNSKYKLKISHIIFFFWGILFLNVVKKGGVIYLVSILSLIQNLYHTNKVEQPYFCICILSHTDELWMFTKCATFVCTFWHERKEEPHGPNWLFTLNSYP